MDAQAMKDRLTDAASRVQVGIDQELAAMRAEFGPLVEVSFDRSWSGGRERIAFSARVATDYPDVPDTVIG